MRLTRLLRTARGVPCWQAHVLRLGLERAESEKLLNKIMSLGDGAYRVRVESQGCEVTAAAASWLAPYPPTRWRPTPLPASAGPVPKPEDSAAWAQVRQPGVLTLLGEAPEGERYEACIAALVGWDGQRLLLARRDCPQVWSTAAHTLEVALGLSRQPLMPGLSLAAVNAVAGVVPLSRDFPPAQVELLAAALLASARG